MSSIASVVSAIGLAAAISGACGSDATEEDQVRSLIADSIEVENRTYDVICDCHEELGHDSREDCLDKQLLPSQRRCVEDAYLADTGASRQYLDCRLPLLGELEDCLDDKLECSDLGPTDQCYDDFDLGLEKCVMLPNAVNRDLDDCYPDGGLAPGSDGNPVSGDDDDDSDSGDDDDDDDIPGDDDDDDDSEPCPGFECDNGSCIPPEFECDGYADCEQAEDEIGC